MTEIHESPAPKRRVLFVSHAAGLDGAERGLLELARGLQGRGHEVSVLLPKDGPLRASLAETGIATSLTEYPPWARDRSSAIRALRYRVRQRFASKRIEKVIREIAPQVVITNTVMIPAAAMAAERLGIPHIWYLREFGAKDHGFEFDYGLEESARLIDSLSALVVVNCVALKDYFAEWIPPEKMTVVYNAVELGVPEETLAGWRDTAPRESALRCVLLGNIRPPKGQEEAIRAMGYLAEQAVDARLALVGRGNEAEIERLRQIARTLGVDDRVDFVGYSTEPLKHLCQSDVALVCSTFEAFGRVTVEALKCSTPVVCTDRGGVVEHIEAGINGYVYPLGEPRTLADSVATLAGDRALLEKMSDAARTSANARYNRDRQVREVEEAIERALAAPIKSRA